MKEKDCRTIAIEVGMQNGGLAPAVFGPLMNVTGSLLASWWHRHPPKD